LQEYRDSGGKVIRAVKPSVDEARCFAGFADALLFEMGEPGSGASYDYSKVPVESCKKAIIAGGLRIDNLGSAKAKRPYALDVSSGVESAPGRKDRGLVSEFIRRCKE
jgi:phosphoribosylanthranilate isomerase